MKRFHTAVIPSLLVLSSFQLRGQVTEADSAKYFLQLVDIEQRLLDDVALGITANYETYLHPACFITAEDGTVQTKKELIAGLHPLPNGYSGSIKVTQPKTVFCGNTAVIRYVADEVENVFGNKLHTQYSTTNTWIRTDTSWEMIAGQTFEIPLLPPPISVPFTVLERYTGIYRLSDSVTCTVSVQNDTLYYQRVGRARTALFPETENTFFRTADARGRKIFVKNERGAMLMKERRNGQDVIWKRMDEN
jgi:hypothetical protein